MTCEEECIKKADKYATEASKYLTRLIGAENRDGNPDIIKTTKISPECPLEGLMLKQKLQHFGHLM